MSKNTILFLILLAVLAVGVGYGKYVLVPKYNRTVVAPTSLKPSPVVSDDPGVPMGDAIAAKMDIPDIVSKLTPEQKIMEVVAVSVQLPVATNSASYALVEKSQPGIINLVGSTSTASAHSAISLLGRLTATRSAQLSLFASSPTGTSPQLCTYDPDCLSFMKQLQSPILMSEPLSASASAEDVVSAFNTGVTIVTLNSKTKQPQLTQIVTDLAAKYAGEIAFKQLIDGKVFQVVSLKQEYH